MEEYSELMHQESIKRRLVSRDNGFSPSGFEEIESIPDMFERQVSLHPNKQAIVAGDKSITYEGLDWVTRGISAAVDQESADATSPIAIFLSDHINFSASMLAVLRSGRYYVPLDPSFSDDRNSRIIQECKANVVLTERLNLESARRVAPHANKIILVEDIDKEQGPLSARRCIQDLACVIFTSGSTGRPKGVVQTHRNLFQVARRLTDALGLGSLDRVSLLSSPSVTASIGTILASLLNGSTLCGFSVLKDGLSKLAAWLDAEQITVYRSVPSLFRHLMDSLPSGRLFDSVKIVRLGGDSLYRSDWELFKNHFPQDSTLINFYGCSELSTVSCFYMDYMSQVKDEVLPVGYPLPGVEVSVLNKEGVIHPVSKHNRVSLASASTGEIVLHSRYLSPGYWNDAAVMPSGFSSMRSELDHLRLYRTGDFGAFRPGCGLVHLGRADSQVKISGFRVELAEVEGVLRTCPGVKEAAVVMQPTRTGERELIGFVTSDSPYHGRSSEIRLYVQAKLPSHMVPSEIICLDHIPYTPNGKIDRGALVQMRDENRRKKAALSATTPIEEALCTVWKQVLTLDLVGVEDNFFQLGGSSILGMKLSARISELFSLSLPVHLVYQHPTIREMAQYIGRTEAVGERSFPAGGMDVEAGRI